MTSEPASACDPPIVQPPSGLPRRWTAAGLAIVLLGIPAIVFAYRLLVGDTTAASQLVIRELAIFALGAALLWIVMRKERLPLASIGIRSGDTGRSLLWGCVGFLMLGVGTAAAIGLLRVSGLSYGSSGPAFAAPAWVTLLIVLRAGIVEEIFYRGYAIERLEALTGSRAIAIAAPLICFAAFHFRQGLAGVLIALMLGAILTGLYIWKRNLIANMAAHFLIDFVPNVILPLLLIQ